VPKPVAVRYWYGAWRRGATRQAVGSKTVAVATVSARRLAAGMCSPGGNGVMWCCFLQQRLAVGVRPSGGILSVSI